MVRDELLATASLAHLGLTVEEAEASLPAFEQMLEYFAAMKAADQDGQLLGLLGSSSLQSSAVHPFRDDNGTDNNLNNNNTSTDTTHTSRVIGPDRLANLADTLLLQAPESENNFIVLPNVL